MKLTAEKLQELIVTADGDPVARFMRSKGFDPTRGAMLIIPRHLEGVLQWGPHGPPRYVRHSQFVEEIVFCGPRND